MKIHKKNLICFLLLLVMLAALRPAQALAEAETEAPVWDFEGLGFEGVMEDFMQQHRLEDWRFAMGWYDTVTGDSWYYNPDQFMVAGSMYKLPLNMLYYDKIRAGELEPDTLLYGIPLEKLMYESIVNSSNSAAQVLKTGLEMEPRQYRKLMAQYPGLDPESLPDGYYGENRMSPRFLIGTLQYLYDHAEDYEPLIEQMKIAHEGRYFKQTEGDYEIAHKYGMLGSAYGDCAIVYTPRPFLLAVFLDNVPYSEDCLGQLCALMTAYSLYLTEQEELAAPEAAPQPTETTAPTSAPRPAETPPPLSPEPEPVEASEGRGAESLYLVLPLLLLLAAALLIRRRRAGQTKTRKKAHK